MATGDIADAATLVIHDRATNEIPALLATLEDVPINDLVAAVRPIYKARSAQPKLRVVA